MTACAFAICKYNPYVMWLCYSDDVQTFFCPATGEMWLIYLDDILKHFVFIQRNKNVNHVVMNK